METQKKKVEQKDCRKHLQFIPLFDEECLEAGDNYNSFKKFQKVYFDSYEECNCLPVDGVNYTLFYNLEDYIDENGVTKAVCFIIAMLYLIKKDAVYDELGDRIAHEAYHDILDLETGAYDYLFEPEDLKLLKEDMKTVREYLDAHPDLKEG